MLVQSAGVSSNTSGEIRDRLGTANVRRLGPFDRETSIGDQLGDRPIQVATIGDSLLQWCRPVLPFLDVGIGRGAVLHKVKRATGTNDTTEFSKRRSSIRDRAQGEGKNACVTAVIIER